MAHPYINGRLLSENTSGVLPQPNLPNMDAFFDRFLHAFERPLTNPVLVFSLILFIILLSPILLRRLKIPGIIGLILSGVIIGPYGLNLLTKSSAVTLFSTIGLLYIMFIAGLELDLNEFRKHRHKSFIFGFLTFLLPLSIGLPVCHYLLGYSWLASLLTASMFATHTLVAYPIVSKFGITKHPAVAITVGGTILTDTAVLLLLAVITSGRHGQLTWEFWARLLVSLSIFSVIMFWVIPRVARWFFRRLESEKTSHYIFVLSVVFFAAFLAEAAGVEPIIGAFVAGLALNRLIPHSSALMNRIDFIGNAIFIPFFLISVGMLVNIQVLANGPAALIVAITLTVVALTGKWLAAWVTQLIFRYNASERQLIFGLSSAHAAATLAVILVGYQDQIIDENILNGTIILILFTCVAASFATEAAARKMVLASGVDASPVPVEDRQHEHILLPVANMRHMESLLDFAILIRSRYSVHPITILSVVPNDEEAEINIQKARQNLEDTVKYASASETLVDVVAAIDHNAASGIVRKSKEILADSIVLGWPRKIGLLGKLLNETTESIVNGTDKTIFICHWARPLPTHTRLVLLCPPLAELEKGFSL